jgi:hypothetical protein
MKSGEPELKMPMPLICHPLASTPVKPVRLSPKGMSHT